MKKSDQPPEKVDILSIADAKEAKAKIARVENPCRGYYSETITEVDYREDGGEILYGGAKRTNFLWKIKTEKHAPTIKSLRPPKRHLDLKDAERWMTFDDDDFIVSIKMRLTVAL